MSAPLQTSARTLAALLELGRRARHAADDAELRFMAVNDSHELVEYRQAVLWFADRDVVALSGVVQIEANVPYVQWLQRICAQLHAAHAIARQVSAADLAPAEGEEWDEWLPAYGLWLPLESGALLLAREAPWQAADIALMVEWLDTWLHAWQAGEPSRSRSLTARFNAIGGQLKHADGVPWWKQARSRWLAALLLVMLLPVRLTVLAPGELVPANPAVIRAPLDGVVASFAVKPNDIVKAGQLLFSFDQSAIESRLEVARQSMATAEAEYRQTAQLAVSDTKYKGQLANLNGKIEERRTEADYLQGMLERAQVAAPRDGIALFDDPGEWLGRPVMTGERIMRIAAPADIEVEAWLPVGDAIALQTAAPVSLYLNATPLFPVAAVMRYMAHDAVQRPDGSYAYRVRATLDGATAHRIGLKGTAKLGGDRVPLCYWMLRRPLAMIRQFIGW